ncbi:HTH lysR-type domain-containing protein [Vibrio mytili]
MVPRVKKELDLNLLKILVLLEKHRQLKPVAKTLGKSEASISKYLARLRFQLNDELFIRHPHHLEPTDYLTRQLPKISAALDQLEMSVNGTEFDPKTYEKDITICLPQVAQYSFGHLLAMELMSLFPKAYITLTSHSDNSIEDILLGKIDAQLHYFNDELPKSIHQQFIGYARTGVVVPEEIGVTTLEQAAQLPFVMLSILGWKDREQLAKQVMEAQGWQINRVASFDNVSAVLKVIKELGAATVLHEFQSRMDGYQFIPISDSFYPDGLPKIVLQIKQSHRHDAMYQLLTSTITKYITKS